MIDTLDAQQGLISSVRIHYDLSSSHQGGYHHDDNHEIHGGTMDDLYPNGDRFILFFKYDITRNKRGRI